MKLNHPTQRFLQIYKPYMQKSGCKSDAEFCKKILGGFSNSHLSQSKRGARNLPFHILHTFLKHFNLPDSTIFGDQEKYCIIESGTDLKKMKVISSTDTNGFTILILQNK
jgi:hypothetical protein